MRQPEFAGVETIDVNIALATNAITLNAAEIAFQSVTISANGRQQTGAVSLDAKNEQATFTFPNGSSCGAPLA